MFIGADDVGVRWVIEGFLRNGDHMSYTRIVFVFAKENVGYWYRGVLGSVNIQISRISVTQVLQGHLDEGLYCWCTVVELLQAGLPLGRTAAAERQQVQ
jgi:hypothetical protein